MPFSAAPTFSLSVVSHGQGQMIRHLLDDLERLDAPPFEVIVTINLPEDETVYRSTAFPIRIIRNPTKKGFGANHNAAFELSRSEYFAVVNPDIRAPTLKLAELREMFHDLRTGACAPLVFNSAGGLEDSARRFPTWLGLGRRVLSRKTQQSDYRWNGQPVTVDWVAGMFVVFRRAAFRDVGGFDARRFFMYYEDVDICARLRRRGWNIWVQPTTQVVHDAQRASHGNLKHLRWHVTSAFRYMTGL